MPITRSMLAYGISAIALVGGCGPLYAQSVQTAETIPSATTTALSPTSSGIADIVVTARRRAESVQLVPVAIDVVSQKTLQQNNINTLGDLQQIVPSLTINTSLTRDALDFGIRGQSSNGISGLPGVIAYLNEVPLPVDRAGNISGGSGLLFDLENIQILKGPQGTLFGRNTLGGAVLLQSARPTDTFGGRIQIGYGNYNNRELDGMINIPLVGDTLLARIAFNGQKRDGFTHLLSEPGHPNGTDLDARDNYSVRATLSFRPSTGFQNDLIATQSKFDSNGSSTLLTDYNPMSGAAFAFPTLGALYAQQQALGVRTAIPVDTPARSAGRLFVLSNTTKISLNDMITFRNIFGYSRAQTTYQFDLDATALPVLEMPASPSTRTVNQYTEEAQILGKAFGDKLDWIIGGFYLNQPNPNHPIVNTNVFFGTHVDTKYTSSSESKALFGQGTYDLSSLVQNLKFTAGLRYTWDKTTFQQYGGNFGSSCLNPVVDCDAIPENRSKDAALTWTLGFDYQAARNTLLYVASRRGYRNGASNVLQFPGIDPQFGPEFVTDGEIGIKSDWKLGGMPIRTNAAFYYQQQKDIQVSEQLVIPGQFRPIAVTANAAKAAIMGTELEITARPTPDLQLGASFDYLRFHYTSFGPNVDIAQLQANVTTGNPKFKYGFNARYQLPLSPAVGRVSVGAVWNWQSKNGDVSQPGGVIGSYGLLNLSADWDQVAGKPFDLSLYASNVTNKVYGVGTFVGYVQIGYSARTYGEPRMYGVRVRYRFGA